jgi:hypothetical protein
MEVAGIAKSVMRYPASRTDWDEPLPLKRPAPASQHYPVDALPHLLRAAVVEYQSYGQQPLALVASSALAVLSLAAQGHADVARDSRLIGPISLNILVIARSGERKTAADRNFGAPLRDWESRQAEQMSSEIRRREGEIRVWEAKTAGLERAIREAMKNGKKPTAELEARLEELMMNKPSRLVPPRLQYEDANPQSLAYMLSEGYPSASLWSDEGAMFTGSHGMGNDTRLGFMGLLNRLWDGGHVHQDRKQAASVHVVGRRLTVNLMVQLEVLQELLRWGGRLARGTGFFARYLLAAPDSTMGSRIYRSPPEDMPAVAAFQRRIEELLCKPLPCDPTGRLIPPVLPLTLGAHKHWRDYHDEVETGLRPGGEFVEVCDFAAKSAENAARIAACLHIFQGTRGDIEAGTMLDAIRLARWYLLETKRVFLDIAEPQEWVDARKLEEWLAKRGDVPIREILNNGPNELRVKDRRDGAIKVLEGLNRVQLSTVEGKCHLRINPKIRQAEEPRLDGDWSIETFRSAAHPTHKEGLVAEVAEVAVADDEMESGEL